MWFLETFSSCSKKRCRRFEYFWIWSGYFVPRANSALQPHPRFVWRVFPSLWCHRKCSVCAVQSQNCWNDCFCFKTQSVFLSVSIPKLKAKERVDSRPWSNPDMSDAYRGRILGEQKSCPNVKLFFGLEFSYPWSFPIVTKIHRIWSTNLYLQFMVSVVTQLNFFAFFWGSIKGEVGFLKIQKHIFDPYFGIRITWGDPITIYRTRRDMKLGRYCSKMSGICFCMVYPVLRPVFSLSRLGWGCDYPTVTS